MEFQDLQELQELPEDELFSKKEPEPVFRITPEMSQMPASPLSDGMNAYHKGEYETAVEQFDVVLGDHQYDGESQIKAAYWRAEALTQQNYSRERAQLFLEVAAMSDKHCLATAAKRRAEAIQRYFDIVDPQPQGEAE